MNARHCAVRMRTVMSESSSSGSSCDTNAGSVGERMDCFGFSDISSTQQDAASASRGKELRHNAGRGVRGLRVGEDGVQEGHEVVLHLVGRVVDVQKDRGRVQTVDSHLLVLGRSHRLNERVVAHAVYRCGIYIIWKERGVPRPKMTSSRTII